jgi:hypothetical protein
MLIVGQFGDGQLRAIIARDAWMLQPGWVVGAADNPPVPLERVVDHIDHVCQLAGSSRHAAVGTDLDGGFGREQSPHDLDTIADLQRPPDLQLAAGAVGITCQKLGEAEVMADAGVSAARSWSALRPWSAGRASASPPTRSPSCAGSRR